MEQNVMQAEDVDHSAREARRVRAWRAEQLRRLGLPFILADAFADEVDWHAVAALMERGCPLGLAFQIVR
jgi:anti-sigma regulatory factor (Ser/Thr protein kinase)